MKGKIIGLALLAVVLIFAGSGCDTGDGAFSTGTDSGNRNLCL